MMIDRFLRSLLALPFVLLVVSGAAAPLHAENIRFPERSRIIDVTKPPYNAKGDGTTDDTAALQKVIDDNKGNLRTIYFPNGTYLLSDSVGIFGGKAHSRDRFLTLQGQSEAGVVLKLKDNSPGFDDPKKPRILLSLYHGDGTGDVMHTYARNFTVDVGSGNPGAVGLRFMSNNVGGMDRVTIRSSDPARAGWIGLDLRQHQNGPAMIKRVTVEGFDRGVEAGDGTFSLVMEHITLRHQREVGFLNNNARMTIRGLRSDNAVPALVVEPHSQFTLIEADLRGGGAGQTAIRLRDPKVFLRDIRSTGYGNIIETHDKKLIGGPSIEEWCGIDPVGLFQQGKPTSLRLPIEETPDVRWEEDLDKWFTIESDSGDITDELQAAIDAAARTGKTTLYFPTGDGKYTVSRPIRIHGSVNCVIGMSSLINVTDPTGKLKDTAAFTLEDLRSDVFVIERFFILGGWNCPKHVVMVKNNTKATVVLKDAGINGITKAPDPGGRWFIENVSPSRESTLHIARGERVWARQWNPESRDFPLMEIDGGQLWVLGLKTEGRTEHVIARNGAKVEILGGVAYQSWGDQPRDPPMFRISDSSCSVTIGFYHYRDPFKTIVEETFKGRTRQLLRDAIPGYHLSLYRSAASAQSR